MTASTPDGPARQLRLPGSVAEVDASPEGPGIGAFFDLDGTLVAGFTATAHTMDRLRHRQVGPGDFLRLTQLAVEYKLGRREIEALIERRRRPGQGAAGRGRRGDGRTDLPAVRGGPDLPGDAQPGPRPPAPRAHRGAQLGRADHASGAGSPLPGYRPRGVQPVRDRRARRPDRRHPAAGHLGSHQGHQRAGVRRRARHRPGLELLLRRRRRGPGPHVPGRAPAAGQPRARP